MFQVIMYAAVSAHNVQIAYVGVFGSNLKVNGPADASGQHIRNVSRPHYDLLTFASFGLTKYIF